MIKHTQLALKCTKNNRKNSFCKRQLKRTKGKLRLIPKVADAVHHSEKFNN